MSTKSKGSRKVGRSINSCKAYKLSKRREHNKVLRLKKHLKEFIDDKVAKTALDHYKIIIGIS